MKVKILGTRGKIKTKARRYSLHSGILIDDKMLFDVGEKKFLKSAPDYIFFTHLHPDHAWFIETKDVLEFPAEIYTPESTKLIKEYSVLNKPIQIEDYLVTPIPTIHSIKVKSQGYLIERDGKRIFYSGDMVWIEKKYLKPLKDLDAVITDGSFIRKGGAIRRKDDQIFGHNGIPNLVHFFGRFTSQIIFMHFGSWFMKDTTKAKKKIKAQEEDNLKIEIAYDGREFII